MIDILIETAVWSCADEESARYALSGLKVIPRSGGGAWVIATDGRCCSITPVKGVCDEVSLMPASLVKKQIPVNVSFAGGEWRTSKGRVAEPVDGKFPDIGKMFAEKFTSIDGQFEETFNPSLLLKVRDAIQEKSEAAARTFTADSESPIAILAGDGFGMLMPMNADGLLYVGGKRDVANRLWRDRVEAFVSDWMKVHPESAAQVKRTAKKAATVKTRKPKKPAKKKVVRRRAASKKG